MTMEEINEEVKAVRAKQTKIITPKEYWEKYR